MQLAPGGIEREERARLLELRQLALEHAHDEHPRAAFGLSDALVEDAPKSRDAFGAAGEHRHERAGVDHHEPAKPELLDEIGPALLERSEDAAAGGDDFLADAVTGDEPCKRG